MHIIYRITHLKRKEDNNPPYYYIGSKWNYKGEGSYYGSSRHEIMKKALPEELDFKILYSYDSCTKDFLVRREKEIQQALRVVRSIKYFNKSIACPEMYKEGLAQVRVAAFKRKAYSRAPCGKLYKDVWAEKAKESKSKTTEEVKALRSKSRSEALLRIEANGNTVAKNTASKSHATLSKVDENGLTGYQKQAIKLKETLKTILPSGETLAEARGRKTRRPCVIAGIEFKSRTAAREFFQVCNRSTIDLLMEGKAYPQTISKIRELHGDVIADKFTKIVHSKANGIEIGGNFFTSNQEAADKLGVGTSTIEVFRKTRELKGKLKIQVDKYNV